MVQNITFRSLSACNVTGGATAPAQATAQRVAGARNTPHLLRRVLVKFDHQAIPGQDMGLWCVPAGRSSRFQLDRRLREANHLAHRLRLHRGGGGCERRAGGQTRGLGRLVGGLGRLSDRKGQEGKLTVVVIQQILLFSSMEAILDL